VFADIARGHQDIALKVAGLPACLPACLLLSPPPATLTYLWSYVWSYVVPCMVPSIINHCCPLPTRASSLLTLPQSQMRTQRPYQTCLCECASPPALHASLCGCVCF
jgi:hypothetical protein